MDRAVCFLLSLSFLCFYVLLMAVVLRVFKVPCPPEILFCFVSKMLNSKTCKVSDSLLSDSVAAFLEKQKELKEDETEKYSRETEALNIIFFIYEPREMDPLDDDLAKKLNSLHFLVKELQNYDQKKNQKTPLNQFCLELEQIKKHHERAIDEMKRKNAKKPQYNFFLCCSKKEDEEEEEDEK